MLQTAVSQDVTIRPRQPLPSARTQELCVEQLLVPWQAPRAQASLVGRDTREDEQQHEVVSRKGSQDQEELQGGLHRHRERGGG